eukprot:jgi/Bigna1/73618/fgenesh1_pg.25_\
MHAFFFIHTHGNILLIIQLPTIPTTISPTTVVPTPSPSSSLPFVGTGAPTLSPPPYPTDSWFQDDCSKISVSFSHDTNGEATEVTNCTELFEHTSLTTFGTPTEVRCRWVAPAMLEITLGSQPTIIPNDTITFAENALFGTSGSAQRLPVSVRVRQAANPSRVSVTISGAFEVSACTYASELIASAQGSAGRPMRYQWEFLGPDLVSLQATKLFSAAVNATTSYNLKIKVGNMTIGTTYKFRVLARNWLDASAESTFYVTKARGGVPKFQLPSATTISIRRSQPLSIPVQIRDPCLNSNASTSESAGGESGVLGKLDVQIICMWSQSPLDEHLTSIPNPTSSYLLLPPYRLEIGRGEYHFTLQAQARDVNGQFLGESNITFTVNVESEAVVACIAGGDDRLLDSTSNQGTIHFDASQSVDLAYPDVPPSLYAWRIYHCNNGTHNLLLESNGTAPVLTPPPNFLSANTKYRVTVIVTGRFNRSSSYTQRVTTTAIPVPQVSVELWSESLLLRGDRVDPGKKIAFRGRSSGNQTGPFHQDSRAEFLWKYKVSTYDSDGSSSSNFAFDSLKTPMLLSSGNGSYLVLRPNALSPGASYTFQLEVTTTYSFQSFTGRAAVTIQTNSPPSLGICAANPEYGLALITNFRLICWFLCVILLSKLVIDECCKSTLGNLTKMEAETRFPTLTLQKCLSQSFVFSAVVQDAFGAESSRHFTVNVSQPPSLNLDNAENLLQKRLDEGDTQSFVVIAAGTARYLAAQRDQINETESETARANLLSILRKATNGNIYSFTSLSNSSHSQLSPENSAALVSSITDYVRPGEIDDFQTQSLVVGILKDIANSSRLAIIGIKHSIAAVSNLVSSSVEALRDNSTATRRMKPNQSQGLVDVLSGLSLKLVNYNAPGENVISVTSKTNLRRLVKVNLDCQKLTMAGAQGHVLRSQSSVAKVHIPSELSSYVMLEPGLSPAGLDSSVIDVSLISVEGDSLYPYPPPPQNSTVINSENADVVIIELFDQGGLKIPLNNLPEGQRFNFTIPGKAMNLSRVSEAGVAAHPVCEYWNLSQKGWRSDGMKGLKVKTTDSTHSSEENDDIMGGDQGGITCESSHLTAFHGRMEFVVQINTIRTDDIKDKRSLDPTQNPMSAFIVACLSVIFISLIATRKYDAYIMKRKDAEELEKKFWRRMNVLRSYRVSAQSWYKWRYVLSWSLRRRHTWISMCFRPRGDYLNSQKRVVMLSVLIFNSATVCALFIGTDQKLLFLPDWVSIALVTAVMSFPVPYVFGHIFFRAPPKCLRVQLKDIAVAVGTVGTASRLIHCLNLCENLRCKQPEEMEIMWENDDSEDDYDDDDDEYIGHNNKNRYNHVPLAMNSLKSTLLAQNSLQKSSRPTVKSEATYLHAEMSNARHKIGYKKRMSRNGSMHSRSASIHSRNLSVNVSKDSVNVLSTKGGSIIKRMSFAAHMQRRWIEESELSTYEWSNRDWIGLIIAFIVVAGCSFLQMVLAWSLYDKSMKAVETTLKAFAHDVLARLLFLFALNLFTMLPFCCLNTSETKAEDKKIENFPSTLYRVKLPCDIPQVRYDENLSIVHLYPEARKRIHALGDIITSVNGEPVQTAFDCKKALRKAHGMGDIFILTLEGQSGDYKKAREQKGGVSNNDISLPESCVPKDRKSVAKSLRPIEMASLQSRTEFKTEGRTRVLSSRERDGMTTSQRDTNVLQQSLISKGEMLNSVKDDRRLLVKDLKAVLLAKGVKRDRKNSSRTRKYMSKRERSYRLMN